MPRKKMTMVHDNQLPMTATQLVGHTTGSVVKGLSAPSPWMLGVVILNVLGIGAAVYFLNILIVGQQGHLRQVLDVQQNEVRQIIDMHNREFDALMLMIGDNAKTYAAAVDALKPIDLPVEAPPPVQGKRQ